MSNAKILSVEIGEMLKGVSTEEKQQKESGRPEEIIWSGG